MPVEPLISDYTAAAAAARTAIAYRCRLQFVIIGKMHDTNNRQPPIQSLRLTYLLRGNGTVMA